jgi:hypothetical protein
MLFALQIIREHRQQQPLSGIPDQVQNRVLVLDRQRLQSAFRRRIEQLVGHHHGAHIHALVQQHLQQVPKRLRMRAEIDRHRPQHVVQQAPKIPGQLIHPRHGLQEAAHRVASRRALGQLAQLLPQRQNYQAPAVDFLPDLEQLADGRQQRFGTGRIEHQIRRGSFQLRRSILQALHLVVRQGFDGNGSPSQDFAQLRVRDLSRLGNTPAAQPCRRQAHQKCQARQDPNHGPVPRPCRATRNTPGIGRSIRFLPGTHELGRSKMGHDAQVNQEIAVSTTPIASTNPTIQNAVR